MVSDRYNMKGYNPGHHHHISLHCNQPPEVQNNPEDDLWYFPPIREGNSPPLQMQNNSNDSDFLPIREWNSTPPTPVPTCSCQTRPWVARKFSQQLPLSSSGDKPQLQHYQQPSEGLGQTNILNVVDTLEKHAKVAPYTYSRWLH